MRLSRDVHLLRHCLQERNTKTTGAEIQQQQAAAGAEVARWQEMYKAEHKEKLKLLEICDQLLTEAERVKAGKHR